MFRIAAFLFCSSAFFFLFVGKLYIVPPFGTGLISSIVIFPQALISSTSSIVSVCCIPFRSFWLHLSAPAAQSYQVYLDTKPFISPRADKWYFVAQLAAALASKLSGYTWPNNSMLIGRGRDLGYNRATNKSNNNRVLRLPAIVLLVLNTTFRPGNSGLLSFLVNRPISTFMLLCLECLWK